MAMATRDLDSLPLVLKQGPTGLWFFVGSVPGDLAYEGPAADIARINRLGMVPHTVQRRTWATRDGALAEATQRGLRVD